MLRKSRRGNVHLITLHFTSNSIVNIEAFSHRACFELNKLNNLKTCAVCMKWCISFNFLWRIYQDLIQFSPLIRIAVLFQSVYSKNPFEMSNAWRWHCMKWMQAINSLYIVIWHYQIIADLFLLHNYEGVKRTRRYIFFLIFSCVYVAIMYNCYLYLKLMFNCQLQGYHLSLICI